MLKTNNTQTLIFATLMLWSFVISSCTKQNPEDRYLNLAEKIVAEKPDSALIYLDSIKSPGNLTKDFYMRYQVVIVQAKYKTYKDISNDTLIFKAAQYLNIYSGDNRQKALANLYAGCVCKENKRYTLAMEYLLKANTFAENTEDNKLKALVKSQAGHTFYSENLTDSAISFHKQAFRLYSQTEGMDNEQMLSAYQIAVNYTINKDYDNALHYNEIGLEIARKINNSRYEVEFLNALGVNFRRRNIYNEAKISLLQALAIKGHDVSIHLNLSKTYNELNKKDSALYFGKKAFEIFTQQNNKNPNPYLELTINENLSKLYESNGDYEWALMHFKLYNDAQQEIKNKMRSTDLLKVEKKYNIAQKEKELVKTKLNEQIFLSVALATGLLLVVATLIIVINRSRHKQAQQKNELLDKQLENILFVNDLYKYITSESNTFEKQVDTLTHNLSVKEKSHGYETIQNMLKSMKRQSQENLHQSSLKFLQEQSLNPKVLEILGANTSDLLLVSLLQCKYEFKNIATLLGSSINALHMRRQRLKEKLKNAGINDTEIENLLQ